MHSCLVAIAAAAAVTFLPTPWTKQASAQDWFPGQEILVDCPTWQWEPSPIPGIFYELCFDTVEFCTSAQIGDAICIPSLGVHDVWVTAIEVENGQASYYDGDIVTISRSRSADFSGDGAVGFPDMGIFVNVFGQTGQFQADLDGNGTVGFPDFELFVRDFGKCVNESGTVYESCR